MLLNLSLVLFQGGGGAGGGRSDGLEARMSGWTDWEVAEIWGEFTGLISLPYSPAPHSIIPTEPKQLALLVYYGRLHSKCSRISPCGSRIDLGRALFTVQILFACFLAAGFMKRWKERKPFFIIFFFFAFSLTRYSPAFRSLIPCESLRTTDSKSYNVGIWRIYFYLQWKKACGWILMLRSRTCIKWFEC